MKLRFLTRVVPKYRMLGQKQTPELLCLVRDKKTVAALDLGGFKAIWVNHRDVARSGTTRKPRLVKYVKLTQDYVIVSSK